MTFRRHLAQLGKSPTFIKINNNRSRPAAFEQSLPWADIVETGGYGKVAWYSKDVMKWPNGHVECIAIAKDSSIKDKYYAVKEVDCKKIAEEYQGTALVNKIVQKKIKVIKKVRKQFDNILR